MVILCPISGETITLASTVPAPFCLPTSNAQELQFLCILANTCYFLDFLKTVSILIVVKNNLSSLVAQLVKNPPAMMMETRVRSLGWEDPLEKGTATHSNILAWRVHGVAELDTTEPLSHFESYFMVQNVDSVPCIFHCYLKGMCILQELNVIVLKYQLGQFVDSVA